jgi:uncharacterized membrane protein
MKSPAMDDAFWAACATAGMLIPLSAVAFVVVFVRLSTALHRVRELEREAFWRDSTLLTRVEKIERRLANAEASAARASQAPFSIIAPSAPVPPSLGAPEPLEATPAPAAPEAANEATPASSEPTNAPSPASAPDSAPGSAPASAPADREVIAEPPASAPAATEKDAAPPSVGPTAPPRKPAGAGIEQWIGVRGAAVLGAAVLVLSGVYFFQYGIEHGLINPPIRVAIGVVVGLGCVVGAELFVRKRFVILANVLTGAGIAILYFAFWAASALYELVPSIAGMALMVVVTAASCVLAVRRSSLAIAIFGLAGGFATPILLSTGSDRPVALFSYLLLLDAGLLFIAHKRRWPLLALFSAVGTIVYELLWVVGRMDGDRLALGMAIVAVFGVLFAIVARPRRAEDTGLSWHITRIVSALLPFAFAFFFGARADFGEYFWPIAAFLALLTAGVFWVAHREKAPWMVISASAASLGTMLAWIVSHGISPIAEWEVAAFSIVYAGGLHLAVERGSKSSAASWIWIFGAVFATGFASIFAVTPWPWAIAWLVLAMLGLRQASFDRRALLSLAAGALLAIATLCLHLGASGDAFPSRAVMVAVVVAIAALFHLGTLVFLRAEAAARIGGHATALVAAVVLLDLAIARAPVLFLSGGVLLLVLLALAGAVRARSLHSAIGIAFLTALALGRSGLDLPVGAVHENAVSYVAHLVAILVLVLAPLVMPRRERDERAPWRGAALAAPMLFLGAAILHERLFGMRGISALPIGIAVVLLVPIALLRISGPSDPAKRVSATAWLSASAMAFVTVAIPLELENEWITIAWALEGAAALLLWRRLDHAGLKYFALVLFGAAGVRLLANPYVLEYYPRGSLRILNWIAYGYLVPTACFGAGWLLLRALEIPRRRAWERAFFPAAVPLLANACAALGFAVFFAWMNLAILDWYATGATLEIAFENQPARDLTMSIAWALYAIGLLAIGMWRRSVALRIVSLALILVTSAKVFLYDLSSLEDLYRVASLVGLAISLIAISVIYRRFVFRKTEEQAA